MDEMNKTSKKKKGVITIMQHPEQMMVQLSPDAPDIMGSALYRGEIDNSHPPEGTTSSDLLEWCAEHQL